MPTTMTSTSRADVYQALADAIILLQVAQTPAERALAIRAVQAALRCFDATRPEPEP